jgi:phosphoribosylanthranilate isomerase
MPRTRIKICGLTREADVEAAVDAGADAIGFVMWAGSRRAVALGRAVELASRLPPFVTPVLLFVNASPSEVQRAVEALPAALLQFHGDETSADCQRHGRPFLRAVAMDEGVDLLDWQRRFSAVPEGSSAHLAGLLLDAPSAGYGGSGKVFDWSRIPAAVACPLVLSGGLNPANVTDGVLSVRPWAVDVSSGVEDGVKGVKNANLIRRFCKAVREADEIASRA